MVFGTSIIIICKSCLLVITLRVLYVYESNPKSGNMPGKHFYSDSLCHKWNSLRCFNQIQNEPSFVQWGIIGLTRIEHLILILNMKSRFHNISCLTWFCHLDEPGSISETGGFDDAYFWSSCRVVIFFCIIYLLLSLVSFFFWVMCMFCWISSLDIDRFFISNLCLLWKSYPIFP